MKNIANIDHVLSKFGEPSSTRYQEWKARCPAHPDDNPSLSIKLTEDTGKILLHCHAGCSTEEVLIRAGLEWSDLFPKEERS